MLFFLFLFCSLYGEDSPLPKISDIQSQETNTVLTNIGSEPSTIVGGCVNVISGDYIEHEVDLTIPASEPFVFSRSYSSSDMRDTLFFNCWHINHQGYMILSALKKQEEMELLMIDLGASGSRTYFKSLEPLKTKSFHSKANPLMYEKGLTNISQGIISGQNNLKNTRCVFKCSASNKCTVREGSGETREYLGLKPAKEEDFNFKNIKNFFREYILKNIKKPSGMSFELSHIHLSHLESVVLKNRNATPLATLKVSYYPMYKEHGIHHHTVHVEAPDGRFVDYKLESFGKSKGTVLKKVFRSDGPTVQYELEDGDFHKNEKGQLDGHYPRTIKKIKPEGRFLKIGYYDLGKNEVQGIGKSLKIYRDSPAYNRVKEISAPLGTDETPRVQYSFDYCVPAEEGVQWGTGVYDALGNKTDYFFNRQNRLEQILKYHQGNIPYTQEDMYWWDKDTPEQICLKTRAFGPWGSKNKIYVKSYFYDKRGNLVLDALYGNITGKPQGALTLDRKGNIVEVGADQKLKECVYSNDGMNLLVQVKEQDNTRLFSYVPGTNLLSSTICMNPQQIYQRSYYEYDENALIVKSITDDGGALDPHNMSGVNLRTIEYTFRSKEYPFGLPLEIKKMVWDRKTGQETLVRREVNRFDIQGRMIEKEVYDADDEFAYSQAWQYNDWGNLILEKDALGHIVTKDYDKNGNLIREEGPILGTFKTYVYDYSNRLIRIDEHHPDGILTQHFKYDLMGNKIVSIDPFGNRTDYTYDAFGRVLSETGPPLLIDGVSKRPTSYYAYDELSHPIAVTDPKGNTTKTAYTIFGKPYLIEYPDGSSERFEYDLENHLVKEVAKNGSITLNTYDYQGRITKKELLDPTGKTLNTQEWGYNAVHLLYEKEASGLCTSYRYDAQGRKVAIMRGSSETTLEYDTLGRVVKTTYENTVKRAVYDVLDRIVEEKEEDLEGNLLKSTSYEYDALGRKIAIHYGTGNGYRCTYDTHGLLVENIDPEGYVSRTSASYGKVYVLETVDPKGIKTTTTFDSKGKPVAEKTTNPFGMTLHEKNYAYDLSGNRTQVIDIPYREGVAREAQENRSEYDVMNRLVASIQAAGSIHEKRTEHHYNLAGEKIRTLKPDGTAIQYSYDALGRLENFASQDFHYRYTYDANSDPIQISDLIHHQDMERNYDVYHHLTKEKLQNGLCLDLNYAPDGKILSVTLPDKTGISYSYQGSFLKTIERLSKKGGILYSHLYNSYDQEGRLLKETLFHSIGEVTYAYTPSGNLLQADSPFFTEKCTQYDAQGNLLARSIRDSEGVFNESYTYDELGQLTQETGLEMHTYQYDSLCNRVSKDGVSHSLNLLNQLSADEHYSYSYDLCGNLIEKSGREGTTQYTYDTLDRLIKVRTPQDEVAYTYDAENRCMTIVNNGKNRLHLFYLAQAELGACNSKGEVVQLQILGLGRRTEPTRAVAIEIDQIPYAMLHDQSGHVRALVDRKRNRAATYQYTAYGMIHWQKSSVENPWTMAGKRYEPSTGLVLFGRRFYAPEMGRWITQDPAGYSVSPNLYAYLSNSPLVHYDAYGLFENVFSNFVQGFIDTSFIIGKFALQSFGNAFYLLSWNLVPLPLIKDLPMAAGYFLLHGNLREYTMSYREQHSFPNIHGSCDPKPGTGHCAGNGLMTTQADRDKHGTSVAAAYNDERVHMANMASHGLIQDVCECLLQKIGVRTHQTQVTETVMHRAHIDAGGVGSGRFVSCDFHSRGASTLENARQYIPREVEQMLYISTYGAASIADSKGAAKAVNYIGTRDYIVAIANPIAYPCACIFGGEHIKFVSTQKGLMGHSFQGSTYQGALESSARKFNEFVQWKRTQF